ncbi:gamma-butyrobetaine hydroxylase-like domain-containing protein [Rhizobium sp. SGZ-381]|uniref:gamma-butyrobetaine hydroxylase-like domain-containing protein n=1 Tax=Rhizobium sp. SGZ-381 TaxID=3342800 RepID=UPI00366BA6FB
MSDTYDKAWPTELRVSEDKRLLTVAFDDGRRFELPAEMLRVLSPSAEVQGHGPGQKVTVPGKRLVGIRNVVAAGNYAVRIAFDDGHDSGIFTWRYLRELGETGDALFGAYEAELAEKGLNRDTPAMAR